MFWIGINMMKNIRLNTLWFFTNFKPYLRFNISNIEFRCTYNVRFLRYWKEDGSSLVLINLLSPFAAWSNSSHKLMHLDQHAFLQVTCTLTSHRWGSLFYTGNTFENVTNILWQQRKMKILAYKINSASKLSHLF